MHTFISWLKASLLAIIEADTKFNFGYGAAPETDVSWNRSTDGRCSCTAGCCSYGSFSNRDCNCNCSLSKLALMGTGEKELAYRTGYTVLEFFATTTSPVPVTVLEALANLSHRAIRIKLETDIVN